MTTIDNSDKIQEYLILKAKESLVENDNFMAKSWFLVASSLYPNSFKIQFERYILAKKEENIVEACKIFTEIVNLPENELMLKEIDKIVDEVSNSSEKCSSAFYRKLFQNLLHPLQYKLLLSVASSCKNPVRYCQLMMLIMKRFPDKINEHALNLVDIIIRGETFNTKDLSQSNEYFSKLLIFEVFPLILSVESNLILSQEHVQQLLENLFKFFLQQSSIGKANEEQMESSNSMQGVQSKLREIFELICIKMQWPTLIELENLDWRTQYFKLSEYYKTNGAITGESGAIDLSCTNKLVDAKLLNQVFFSAFMLFLIYLDQYIRLTVNQLVVVQHHVPLAKEKLLAPLGPKKRKTCLDLTKTAQPICNSQELQNAFAGANKFFEFLNQDHHLQQELFRLIEIIGLNKYKSYETFIIDTYIFRADNGNLLSYFQNNPTNSLKSCVQLVSSSAVKADLNLIFQHCVKLVRLVSTMKFSEDEEEKHFAHKSNNRPMIAGENDQHQLMFVACHRDSILAYAIEVMLYFLQDSLRQVTKPSEQTIGHLIVLCQFAWPRYVDVFLSCLQILRENFAGQRFSYAGLLDFIFNADMLEELMALVCQDEGHVDLRIMGQTDQGNRVKKMTTRGVNKNAKEEVKNALAGKMRQSKANLPASLYVDFICNELADAYCIKQKEICGKKNSKK